MKIKNVEPQQVIRLFFEMMRIRLVEEKIVELYSEQEMRCPVHLCIGQEAVAVGVCAQLRKDDSVFSGHRSHGHYLAKGGDLKAMLAELYGKFTGCSKGKGGSMHLTDLSAGFLGATPIVGSTIPIAVGASLASQMRGTDRVTAVFFGDGTVEEGVFHESVNFAVLKKLPILFICENNLYSVYSPLGVRQPLGREIAEMVGGYGLESIQTDGNDVLEVGRMARRAVDKARGGDGPTFLEFKTYRWREHCGPNFDNDLGYRTQSEFKKWKKRCPIENLRKKLSRDYRMSSGQISKVVEPIHAEIADAVRFAKESAFPEEKTLMQHIYA